MVTKVSDLGNGAVEYTIHDSTGQISGKSYNNVENGEALYGLNFFAFNFKILSLCQGDWKSAFF